MDLDVLFKASVRAILIGLGFRLNLLCANASMAPLENERLARLDRLSRIPVPT
jgi:hypothetical protein